MGYVDPIIWLSMGFTLVVLLLLAGFILLFPLSRRLSALLEESIRLRRAGSEPQAGVLEEMRATRELVESLGDRLDAVEERQHFVERLLEAPRSGAAGGEGLD
jgi:hypothetical protein